MWKKKKQRSENSAAPQLSISFSSKAYRPLNIFLFLAKAPPGWPHPGFSRDHEQLKSSYFSTLGSRSPGNPRKARTTPPEECSDVLPRRKHSAPCGSCALGSPLPLLLIMWWFWNLWMSLGMSTDDCGHSW